MSRLLTAVMLLAGCASVDYVGKTYAPTTNVDVTELRGQLIRYRTE